MQRICHLDCFYITDNKTLKCRLYASKKGHYPSSKMYTLVRIC